MKKISTLCLLLITILFLSDGTFQLPLSAAIPDTHADSPETPVNDHRHPDTEYSHPHIPAQDIAEHDPEHPHGENRDHHRNLSISRRAQRGRHGERQRPDQDVYKRQDHGFLKTDGCGLCI